MSELAYDVIEALFEAIQQGENLEDDQGVSLVIAQYAIPRSGSQSDEMGSEVATQRDGVMPSVEMEDVTASVTEPWEKEELSPLMDGWEVSLGRGGRFDQAMGETEVQPSLVRQVAQAAKRAEIAQNLSQRGQGGGTSASNGAVAEGQSATGFSVASATRRQSAATVETARTVDRAIERDARRYDGGFLLG